MGFLYEAKMIVYKDFESIIDFKEDFNISFYGENFIAEVETKVLAYINDKLLNGNYYVEVMYKKNDNFEKSELYIVDNGKAYLDLTVNACNSRN